MTSQESSAAPPQPLSADRALIDPEDDRLGYAPFAKQLARSIVRGCPADGLVIGLYGPWGSGKSTALNFILHYLEQDPDGGSQVVVRFNPWWFAGQEDLVRRFFAQFEGAFVKGKATRRKLLKKVAAFSAAVSELPLPYLSEGAKAVKAALPGTADVVTLKDELVKALAREPTRVVVVVDDVDRLSANEIRQLFQLVKAVADFPNVIYLLAFDREVVARSLEQTAGTSGEDYLEKIVQVPFTLPTPERLQLSVLLFERLNRLVGSTPESLFDQQHWGNVYLDGIEPFIRRPRDIVRLANALMITYPAVEGEVNAVDFIAVEALRLFAPNAYDAVRGNQDLFAGTGDRESRNRDEIERERALHDEWLKDLGALRKPVQELLKRLFPRLESVWGNTVYGRASLGEWRRKLRVCSPEIFPIFFRLGVPDSEVSAATLRTFLAEASDAAATASRLIELSRQISPAGQTRASSLLTRLRDHIDKDVSTEVLSGIVRALFDAGDEIRRHGKPSEGPFDLGDEYLIGWVLQDVLKRIDASQHDDMLKSSFKSGRALVTMTRELAYWSRQHGKWGTEAKPENGRLIDRDTVDSLEPLLVKRIAEAAADGSLWQSIRPVTLLDAWATLGNAEAMRAEVAKHLRDDQALLDFVAQFTNRLSRRRITDRIAQIDLRLDPERLAQFVALSDIVPRLEALSARPWLSGEQRAVLTAFRTGKQARDAGKDPLSFDVLDDDD